MLTLETAKPLAEPCADAEGVADDLRDTGTPDRLIQLTDREILRLVWWMRARRDDGEAILAALDYYRARRRTRRVLRRYGLTACAAMTDPCEWPITDDAAREVTDWAATACTDWWRNESVPGTAAQLLMELCAADPCGEHEIAWRARRAWREQEEYILCGGLREGDDD